MHHKLNAAINHITVMKHNLVTQYIGFMSSSKLYFGYRFDYPTTMHIFYVTNLKRPAYSTFTAMQIWKQWWCDWNEKELKQLEFSSKGGIWRADN